MRTVYTFTFLIILGSLNLPVHLYAQDLHFERITTANGLPENYITAILQDHLGLMWFGSSIGLIKYDGYTFTVYRPSADDSTSIGGRLINALHEDEDGDLWIGTTTGLNRLERDTQRFTRYLHDPEDPTSLADNFVRTLGTSIATPGVLWVGTLSGLIRVDLASGTFTPTLLEVPNTAIPLMPSAIYESPSEPGILWMGSGDGSFESAYPGLIRFDVATGAATGYRYVETGAAYSITEDETGIFWLGTLNGLRRFDRRTGSFERVISDVPGIWSLTFDQGGSLWLGRTDGELGQFDPATGRTVWHRHNPNDPNSPGINTWIRDLYRDRNDLLWIGTRGDGINILDPSITAFSAYRFDPEQGIGIGNIRSILKDRSGTTWVGGNSPNGLERWNRAQGTINHYRHNPEIASSLSDGQVVALYEDNQGTLWVGTCAFDNTGLAQFDSATNSFTHYRTDTADPNSLSNNCVNAIFEDRSSTFWVGTWGGGLNRFDPASGRFTRYLHDPDDPNSIPGNYILAHLEDRNGRLWFGLDGGYDVGGLARFDPASGRFIPFLPQDLRVMALLEDQSGSIWAGTAGGGLYRLDPETGDYSVYTFEDGLANDVVWGLLEDEAGSIWISTDNGLSRFDPGTETFQNYDTRDGLHGHIFSERAAFKTADGEMLFGGQGGLTTFYPERIRSRSAPPPVVLTEFRVAGAVVKPGEQSPLHRHINVAQEVTLNYDQKDIAISFAALSYQRPEKNRYAYYLEGYEETWRAPGLDRTATYTNLDPGRYVFRVKAANRDGVWNEDGISLAITIHPPWWRTLWAYLLYGLLFIGAVFGVDRIQRRRLIARERERVREREREQARQLAVAHAELQQTHEHLKATQAQLVQQEKLASLGSLTAGIAHEIKNPLNFINNFAEVNQELAEELREAVANGEDLSEIIDDLERNAEIINQHGKRADGIVSAMMQHASGGTGERQLTDINRLVAEHVDLTYHGKRAQFPNFTVIIDQDLGPDVGEAEIVPQEIGRVLLNLLGNAFDAVYEKDQTTEREYQPTLRVQTQRTNNAIEIRISDNGPGIQQDFRQKIFEPFFTTKPTGSGTGLGLSLSYDIITKGHGGRLWVESEPGAGATFIISLPV